MAQLDGSPDRRPFVRVQVVAECKWSRDKPWVVLTSPTTRLGPKACVAQTFANPLGAAALALLAQNPVVQQLPIFETPDEGGFGGRQALTKGTGDAFYNAMVGVTSAAAALTREYVQPVCNNRLPDFAMCVFPIVVVDGPMFRASYDEGSGELRPHPVDYVRCHWRGAPAWELHATVDVVRLDAFEAHVSARRPAFQSLVDLLVGVTQEIAVAHAEDRLQVLADCADAGLTSLTQALSIKVPPL